MCLMSSAGVSHMLLKLTSFKASDALIRNYVAAMRKNSDN
jgi:hypothetical protein